MPLERLAVGQEKVIGGFAHLTGIAFELSQRLPPLLKQRRVLYLTKTKKEADWLQTALLFFQPSLQIEEWTSEGLGRTLGVDVLLAYPDSLDAPIISTRDIRELTTPLKVKQTITQSSVVERCTLAGFQRIQKQADQPGTFTTKGDMLEVCISPTHSVRLHWNFDVLSSIERLGNQPSALEAVTIYPHTLQGKGTYTLLDAVRDRLLIREEDTALPTQRATILTLSHFVLDHTEQVQQRRLPPVTTHLDELIHTVEKNSRRWVATHFMAEAQHRLQAFSDREMDWREVNIDLQGFTDTVHDFSLISDTDMFGADWVRQHKPEKTKKPRNGFTLPMVPGDFVVHVYHGIARFSGTTVMEVNGMKRDYLVLEYAGRDKLYVPVETADRVDKYVGSPHPTIHSLHDASWESAVRHIQEHALELAQELLKVYAQREIATAPAIRTHSQLEDHIISGFSYELTPDQEESIQAVYTDLAKTTPMDRLLCGDVGFGKTEVALRATARVMANGFQVAVLAPTTILVQQHFDTFERRLKDTGLNVGLLSRFRSTAEQKQTVKKLASGTVDLVVGTHRLLSKDVQFKKLGLVIVDEEQRFGVKQKELLRKLRAEAHVLTLSATPLPRTLHLALSGVRGISTIATPPPGRLGIQSIITPWDAELVNIAIKRELERKGQVYFLHNDVETIGAKAHELQEKFSQARVAIAHGQLPEQELARVMHAFDTQAVDILVCSTIIENGLDIPQANTLIVERASQFGLAQLHQLRGRIGRSSVQAFAYFFYNSRDLTDDAKLRLKALEEAQDLGAGYELALRDMEIRGVGSILGKNQHGHAETIGLNYYARLLSAAVAELKSGKTQTPIRDIPIDIPLSATIPEDVVPDEGERIQLYQQFANIRERTELHRVRVQWEGKGIEFVHLFQLLEIRLLAQHTPIVSIDTQYPSNHNGLPSEKIVIKSQEPIPYGTIKPPFERVDEWTVRVYLNELKPTWVEALTKWLENLLP